MDDYKYDVAISFVFQDEPFAHQLFNLLTERFRVFFYSRKLEQVTGTDGVDTYTQIFLEDARLNIILYREKWGTTPFTKVEETAIKSRIFQGKHKAWDSLIVVKLDDSSVPAWIPPFYTYLHHKDGIEKIVGVVEYKIQTLGGTVKTESLVDFAARLQRQVDLQNEIEKYLESVQGVKDAVNELKSLSTLAKKKWEQLQEAAPSLRIGKFSEQNERYFEFTSGIYHLNFLWNNVSVNSLHDAYLLVRIYKDKRFSNQLTESVLEVQYKFSMSLTKTKGWTNAAGEFQVSENLLDGWIKTLINIIKDPNYGLSGDEIIHSW
jgi:hypothetical protein